VAGNVAKGLGSSVARSRRQSASEQEDPEAGGVVGSAAGGAAGGSTGRNGPLVPDSHKVEKLHRSIHRTRQLGHSVRSLAEAGVAHFLGARDVVLSRVGSCGRANVVPTRLAAFWSRLGMQAALHLTVFDLLALLLAYVLLCYLNQWAITALLTALAMYSWLLLLLECDMLVRTRADHDGAWVELVEESGVSTRADLGGSPGASLGGNPGAPVVGAASSACGSRSLPLSDACGGLSTSTTTPLRTSAGPTLQLPPPRTPAETFEDALADSFTRGGDPNSSARQEDPNSSTRRGDLNSFTRQGDPNSFARRGDLAPAVDAATLPRPRVPAAASGGAASMARSMYFDKLLDGGAWVRDVRSHFVGGGDAIRAVRLFWWSAVASVCGVTLTALLEPQCNDLPCLQHASACPLPYPLNHRSLGYLIDLLALLLLLAGAGAIRNVLDFERTAPVTSNAARSAQRSQAICFSSGGNIASVPPEQQPQREGSRGAALWGRARISSPNESRLAKCLNRTPLGQLLVKYRVIAAITPNRRQAPRAPGRVPPSGLY
jgi:hypothetical protein